MNAFPLIKQPNVFNPSWVWAGNFSSSVTTFGFSGGSQLIKYAIKHIKQDNKNFWAITFR